MVLGSGLRSDPSPATGLAVSGRMSAVANRNNNFMNVETIGQSVWKESGESNSICFCDFRLSSEIVEGLMGRR